MTDTRSSSPDPTSSQLLLLHAENDLSPLTDRETIVASSRKLSVWNAFVLLVLTQVGAGLFASPTQVDANVPSPGVALIVWLFACLLGWAGASSFADLAALFPTGGMEEYLSRFYGKTVSSLMAWTWIAIVKPSSMAMVSTVLTNSIVAGLELQLSSFTRKFFTAVAFMAIVLPNLHSTRTSAMISNIFLVVKLTTVSLVTIAGIFAATLRSDAWQWLDRPWFAPRPTIVDGRQIDWSDVSWWDLMGHLCAAVYAVLWACTGWDNANFVAREMSNPAVDLPRAIHAAMLLVTICYQLVNISFYILVPWDSFASDASVAVRAAKDLLGAPAAVVIAFLVALVAGGTVSANVFIISRLTESASNKGYIPAIFGQRVTTQQHTDLLNYIRLHVSSLWMFWNPSGWRYQELPAARDNTTENPVTDGVPVPAILLNFALTTLYLMLGSFDILIILNGTAVYSFYFLTLFGLFVYRLRHMWQIRERQRRVFTPLIAPGVFSLVSFMIVLRTLLFFPFQAAILAALLVAGLIVQKMRN